MLKFFNIIAIIVNYLYNYIKKVVVCVNRVMSRFRRTLLFAALIVLVGVFGVWFVLSVDAQLHYLFDINEARILSETIRDAIDDMQDASLYAGIWAESAAESENDVSFDIMAM